MGNILYKSNCAALGHNLSDCGFYLVFWFEFFLLVYRESLLAVLATRVVFLVALDRGCLRQKSRRDKWRGSAIGARFVDRSSPSLTAAAGGVQATWWLLRTPFFLPWTIPSCCNLMGKVTMDRRCTSISYRCGFHAKHAVEQALL